MINVCVNYHIEPELNADFNANSVNKKSIKCVFHSDSVRITMNVLS